MDQEEQLMKTMQAAMAKAPANRATQILAQGSVCAEAVLLAVCQEFGIEDKVDPAIANLFAGGIGSTGSVCGAVVGAVMGIGLVKGVRTIHTRTMLRVLMGWFITPLAGGFLGWLLARVVLPA